MIGERINPTGKRTMQEQLRTGQFDAVIAEAIRQRDCGARILDVNVHIDGTNEQNLLADAVSAIQDACELPLSIDTANFEAMKAALKRARGKVLLNSMTGIARRMDAFFALLCEYGVTAVVLTMDENGVPSDAEGRLMIADRVLERAVRFGIDETDLIFDPIAQPVAYAPGSDAVTLDAVSLITQKLGAATILGISNVSYGLENREAANAAFLRRALQRGLTAAIADPCSEAIRKLFP